MVARNFLEVDANIFYPRTDDTSGNTGIVGMEFPFTNYLHFLLAKVFGYTHWYGRLINLIISSVGLWYFGQIVQLYFTKKTALASTLLLASSIWFAFSRKTMPDTACISLMFIGIYYGIRYYGSDKWIHLLLFILFSSLGILVKIPAGIYLVVILLVSLSKKDKRKNMLILWASALIPLILCYVWYFVHNPALAQQFGNWYNTGQSFSVGLYELRSNLDKVFQHFYFSSFQGFIAIICFVAGAVLMIYKRNYLLLITFLVLFLGFAVYITKAGYFFHHHNYYIIPFVPIMALVAGYALSFIKNKAFFSLLLIGISIESIANQQHDFFIRTSQLYKLELEHIADTFSSRDDLVVINSGKNPQLLYLSHRKGWINDTGQISSPEYLSEIQRKGCKYIIIDKHESIIDLDKPVIYEDENFKVFTLE